MLSNDGKESVVEDVFGQSARTSDKHAAITKFKTYIQAVGKGQRSGRTLSQAEAFDAFSLLLSGQVTQEQRGAFLMLLRVREETPEEIAGFLEAARLYTNPQFTQLGVDIELACYAGKRRHLPWLILSMLCFTQTGKRVFLHGTHEPETKRLYVNDALKMLGFPEVCDQAQANEQLDKVGFAYADLSVINPRLDALIKLRAELGLRSCANTIARMLNPCNTAISMQGVYHRGLDQKHTRVAQILEEKCVCVFRGDAGEVEIGPERDTHLMITRDGQTQTSRVAALNEQWSIKPRELDVNLLVQHWRGEIEDAYGHSACISTLAVMLVLSRSINFDSALQQATKLWKSRDKKLLDKIK